MSGTDNLRTALPTCWYCPECGTAFTCADGDERPDAFACGHPLIEVPFIPPGADLRAVLEATGHEVEEAIYFKPPAFGCDRAEVVLKGQKSSHPTIAEWEQECFVVRPRGETTDGE